MIVVYRGAEQRGTSSVQRHRWRAYVVRSRRSVRARARGHHFHSI